MWDKDSDGLCHVVAPGAAPRGLLAPVSELEARDAAVGISASPAWPVRMGYKATPEDFIVEEVSLASGVNTVEGLETAAPAPTRVGDFIELTLVKRGLTTPQAVDRVASLLGVPARSISYAGLKDRRAVTAQAIRMPAAELRTRELERRTAEVRLLSPRRASGPLRAGDLASNRFRIALRPFDEVAPGMLEEAIVRLRTQGFRNYFDVQRFGRRMNLHVIGGALARGDASSAVERFLFEQSPLEPEHISRARASAQGRWPSTAAVLRIYERHRAALDQEVALLEQLGRQSAEEAVWHVRFVGPFAVRAWVAYLFNRAVSATPGDTGGTFPLFDGTHATRREYASQVLREGRIARRARPFLTRRRRDITVRPSDCALALEGGRVIAAFTLPKGAYATSLLRSLFHLLHSDRR